MFESQPIDNLPIWSVYLLAVIFLFLAAEIGFRLGGFVQKRLAGPGRGRGRYSGWSSTGLCWVFCSHSSPGSPWKISTPGGN